MIQFILYLVIPQKKIKQKVLVPILRYDSQLIKDNTVEELNNT